MAVSTNRRPDRYARCSWAHAGNRPPRAGHTFRTESDMSLRRGLMLLSTLLAAAPACDSPPEDDADALAEALTLAPNAVGASARPADEDAFTAFESGQVRPLALSP